MIRMYGWKPVPSGPARPTGVSANRGHAETAALSALDADRSLMAVLVTEVEASSCLAPYEPTGRTWTWRRTAAGIDVTEALADDAKAALPAPRSRERKMTMSALATEPAPAVPRMLELELTGKCQLKCIHCYGNFGPQGDPGTMTTGDWKSVIGQAAALGVRTVQLIGGEVTLDPRLPELGRHALDLGLLVNVYSNLVKVPEDAWDLLARPGASLSTSWYSADPDVHKEVTGSRAAWALTRRSIKRAVRAGIPLRVAIVGVLPSQDLAAAEADLRAIGVTSIRVRPVQALGRAASNGSEDDPAQLCGHCGDGHATILASGQLAPCGMSRWLGFGSARDTPLAELPAGEPWRQALAVIPPKITACQPDGDADNCSPDDESICPVQGAAVLPLAAG